MSTMLYDRLPAAGGLFDCYDNATITAGADSITKVQAQKAGYGAHLVRVGIIGVKQMVDLLNRLNT